MISVTSIVSTKDNAPYVQMKWGNESGQLTPDEARAHAYGIIQAADAAESDALLVIFLKEKIGIEEQMVASVLRDFRELRERKYTKDGQNKMNNWLGDIDAS